jgi:preprotein translocase subunit YajC
MSSAMADTAPQAGNPLMSFVPMIVVFVIFYFLLIRPQTKKAKQEQELIAKLGKGDEVYTKSGLIGTIYGLTEKVVTLEVSEGVKIKILKNQIGGLAQAVLNNNPVEQK